MRLLITVLICTVLFGALTGSAAGSSTPGFQGRLVLLHGDPKNPLDPPLTQWYLQSGGHHYRLTGTYAASRIGQQVTVSGTLRNDTLTTSKVQVNAAPHAQAAISGSFSALVIMVYWTSPDSRTPASAANQIQGIDGPWFNQTSYGAVTGMTATATPWLQIAPISGCDTGAIASEGEAAAIAAGYTPGSYDRELFYFPSTSACGFGGLAYVPGRYTWYNGQFDTYTTAHELGHNFGLWHSHFDDCLAAGAKVTLGGTCTLQEYGDYSDTMGSGYSGAEYNASQKNALGWLGSRAASVVTSGNFTLSPYESTATGLVQALHIAAPEGDFWAEYRRPLGPDAGLASYFTDGVQMHLTTPGNGSWLLDLQPNQNADWYTDETSGTTLTPGHSWTDPAGAFTLTTNSATSTAAGVTVTFHSTAAPGTPAAQFAVPASMSATGNPPTVPYTVSWTAGSCAAGATYTLQRSTDGGTPATAYSGTAATATVNVTNGHAYAFSVSCGGPASTATFHLNGAQETSATYTGGWTVSTGAVAWGGKVRYSTAKNASATYSCSCEAVALVTNEAANHGSAQVFVDGVLRGTIDTHSATTQNRVVVFKYGWSGNGPHTIKVVNLATKGHPRVVIDGFLTRS